jgi:hypothetical protein
MTPLDKHPYPSPVTNSASAGHAVVNRAGDATHAPAGPARTREPSYAAPRHWELHLEGQALVIDLLETGRWQVVYGGFSRTVSDRLCDAIAVATATNSAEPYVRDIARQVAEDIRSALKADAGSQRNNAIVRKTQ